MLRNHWQSQSSFATQFYRFKWIDINDYSEDIRDFIYESDNINLVIAIECKNNIIYFPYIHFEKWSNLQELIDPIDLGPQPEISLTYYNININYTTYEDIYKFIILIKSLFLKNIDISKNLIQVIGLEEKNLEKSYGIISKVDDFNEEYFVNKINNIINTEKHITCSFWPEYHPIYNISKLVYDYPELKIYINI
jgi:hypothetical protein